MTLNPRKAEIPTVAITLLVIALLSVIGLVGGSFALDALGELAKTTGAPQRDDYLAAFRTTVETVAESSVPDGASDAPKIVAGYVLGNLPTREGGERGRG